MVYIQKILVFLGFCSMLETIGQPLKHREMTYKMPEKTKKQLAAEEELALLFDGFVKINETRMRMRMRPTTHMKMRAKMPEWISAMDKVHRKMKISHRSDDNIETDDQRTTTARAAGGVSGTQTAENATGTPWGIEHLLNKQWPGMVEKSHRGVTRFRLKLEKTPIHNYVPHFKGDSKMKAVCVKRSTIPNDMKVREWLSQERSSYTSIKSHNYNVNLHNLTYTKGNSEECHTPKFNSFHKYIDCAIKRHMRMESLIPKYPLHQIGNPKVE